jgi:hypothetical protein
MTLSLMHSTTLSMMTLSIEIKIVSLSITTFSFQFYVLTVMLNGVISNAFIPSVVAPSRLSLSGNINFLIPAFTN